MLLPGQAVYIPQDKKIGIYLAFSEPKGMSKTPDMYVYTYIGKGGELSDTCVFEPEDLIPLTMPDKKTVTGQSRYKTPFERDSTLKMFDDKSGKEMEPAFLNELEAILKTKWLKKKYDIVLVDAKDDDDAGKGTN